MQGNCFCPNASEALQIPPFIHVPFGLFPSLSSFLCLFERTNLLGVLVWITFWGYLSFLCSHQFHLHLYFETDSFGPWDWHFFLHWETSKMDLGSWGYSCRILSKLNYWYSEPCCSRVCIMILATKFRWKCFPDGFHHVVLVSCSVCILRHSVVLSFLLYQCICRCKSSSSLKNGKEFVFVLSERKSLSLHNRGAAISNKPVGYKSIAMGAGLLSMPITLIILVTSQLI